MTFLEAIVLGIVQGLTEFLPISSTAHLTLAGKLFGIVNDDRAAGWTSFIAVTQLGTLAAVIAYFFADLIRMPRSLLDDARKGVLGGGLSGWSQDSRMLLFMVAGTVPIGIVGLTLSDFLHGVFTKNLLVIGSSLVGLALFLWLAEKKARHIRPIEGLRFADAMILGCAQCLALIPGSSRSGTTMTAGLFLGLTRSTAARFSFLLSVPAVLASGGYELLSLSTDPFEFGVVNVSVAVLFSAISGYAAIAWLLRFLMKSTMMVFVWYRIAVGLFLIVLVSAGILSP